MDITTYTLNRPTDHLKEKDRKQTILKASPPALYSLYEQGAAHSVDLTIFSSGSSENIWYLSPNALKVYRVKEDKKSVYLYWSNLLQLERETYQIWYKILQYTYLIRINYFYATKS